MALAMSAGSGSPDCWSADESVPHRLQRLAAAIEPR